MMLRPLLLMISIAFALATPLTNSTLAAVEVKHPVFKSGVTVKDRSSLEKELDPLLGVADEKLASLVPHRNGLMFCGCPNCDSGAQDGQMTWLGWEHLDKVKCRFCQMIFPNDLYPEDERLTVLNPHGEKVVYRYYQDKNGKRFFFSARARYARKRMLGHLTLQMAKLAHLTKDPVYERKTVVLLNAFGERYPRWCVMADQAFSEQGPLESYPKKPRHYFGGIWNRWFYDDIPRRPLMAYDLVYDSPHWEHLTAQKGLNVRKRLVNDVFRAAVDFTRSYEDRLGNKSPNIYTGMIVAGRVLGEPDYVHEAVDRFRRLVRQKFFFDGMWHEGSISYHRQALSGLQQVMDMAAGYSDPEGYRWPQDGSNFDNLDLVAEFPFFQKVIQAESALVFPNGRIVPVHDAWAYRTRELRSPPETKLLAAMEHCCLHRGSGANQLQARLHFSPGIRHKHQDLLSLILWASGRELLSDIGYTHTNLRHAWTRMTAAHNTVVVNEAEQKVTGDRADLSLFDTAKGLLQTVEATATAAYPRVTSEYRRQLIQVDISPEQAYVVDVFRVSGGDQHDWFLHGSANFDQTVMSSLAMEPVAGTLLGPGASFRMPVSERDDGDAGDRNISYAFIRNLAGKKTDGPWNATFRFNQDSPIQLRTTVLGQPNTTVVLGECPSVRRAKEDNSRLNDFMMPVIAVRRVGNNLNSTFVAVHEPFRDRPFIQNVRGLKLESGLNGAVALEITHNGQRDVVFGATEEYARQSVTIPGQPPIEISGRTGFLRFRGVELVEAYLLDGTHLRCGHVELTLPPAPEGTIASVLREDHRFGFRVKEQLPTDARLIGRTILVTFADKTRHGYHITGIKTTEDGSLILMDEDPGFAIQDDGKAEFLYYPQRELPGPVRYRILSSARWTRED